MKIKMSMSGLILNLALIFSLLLAASAKTQTAQESPRVAPHSASAASPGNAPITQIYDVILHNNHTLKRDRILQAMGIIPEALNILKPLEEYQTAVKKLYDDCGFPNATVE